MKNAKLMNARQGINDRELRIANYELEKRNGSQKSNKLPAGSHYDLYILTFAIKFSFGKTKLPPIFIINFQNGRTK